MQNNNRNPCQEPEKNKALHTIIAKSQSGQDSPTVNFRCMVTPLS